MLTKQLTQIFFLDTYLVACFGCDNVASLKAIVTEQQPALKMDDAEERLIPNIG